jgi:signal peptidase I
VPTPAAARAADTLQDTPARAEAVQPANLTRRGRARDVDVQREFETVEQPRTDKRGHTGRRMFAAVVVAALIALALRLFVVAPYYIPSASMEQTLHGCTGCNNDHVLVDKLSYKLHAVHRGDVVVFHRPASWSVSEKLLIKRVVGLPGDRLTEEGGVVYVNGLALVEPYVDKSCSGTAGLRPYTVPDNQVFVMGDNRCDSQDSRAFGSVNESAIIGRAFIIIWPLGRIHWI